MLQPTWCPLTPNLYCQEFNCMSIINFVAERIITDTGSRQQVLDYLGEITETYQTETVTDLISGLSVSMGDQEQELVVEPHLRQRPSDYEPTSFSVHTLFNKMTKRCLAERRPECPALNNCLCVLLPDLAWGLSPIHGLC